MKKTIMLMLMMLAVATGYAAEKKAEKKGPLGPMDTDGNGEVSKEEFVEAARKRTEENGRTFISANALGTFASKDKNKDGVLTRDELWGSSKKKKPASKKDSKKDDKKGRK